MGEQIKAQRSLRKIAGVTLYESAVQWYCFLLYGTAAGTVFNKVFFSVTGDEITALIMSYMSFAIGYIAGPFGAVFFGQVGDKRGRKFTMYVSLMMMGISTSIIGFLPPAATAGVWIVIVLQIMRLAQCFGRGGTWGGAILLAYENVPENRRNFYACIPQIGLPIGLGLSSIFLLVPTWFLDESAFFSWGWRISFLAAIILTIIAVLLKGHMMETEDFKKAQAKLEEQEREGKKQKVGFIPMVKGYWKTLLLGCGTRWVDGTFYNIFIVWILSYCIGWLGMPLYETYLITIIACIFKIPFTLFGGWCAQRFGTTTTFVIGGLASAFLSIPTLKVIEWSHGDLLITMIGIVIGWSIAYNLIWAVLGSLWSSYFETEVRYSGISFVYHVPSFIVAGIVPAVCTYLISYGNGDTIYVGIYSTVVALISVACALILKRRYMAGKR
ncbi:MAG: MFS transporter [Caecibacter massiliensis]|uniref:MHS family MFS transporter n=1 Tax=Megasphaera hexanoica TaxID=1675036 RepID=A0A848BQK7_9FIRM|nr:MULTISPECIES: MFS transporter [Megasphaera]MDY2905382.1 MFS transporter [Caecibacter massiliensis]NME27138.1 MHS family MFS transporter [Megasphaera hexanoica]